MAERWLHGFPCRNGAKCWLSHHSSAAARSRVADRTSAALDLGHQPAI